MGRWVGGSRCPPRPRAARGGVVRCPGVLHPASPPDARIVYRPTDRLLSVPTYRHRAASAVDTSRSTSYPVGRLRRTGAPPGGRTTSADDPPPVQVEGVGRAQPEHERDELVERHAAARRLPAVHDNEPDRPARLRPDGRARVALGDRRPEKDLGVGAQGGAAAPRQDGAGAQRLADAPRRACRRLGRGAGPVQRGRPTGTRRRRRRGPTRSPPRPRRRRPRPARRGRPRRRARPCRTPATRGARRPGRGPPGRPSPCRSSRR